jgi:hypothetical protein
LARPIKLQWTEPSTNRKHTRSFSEVDAARIEYAKLKQGKVVDVLLLVPLLSFLDIEAEDLERDAA